MPMMRSSWVCVLLCGATVLGGCTTLTLTDASVSGPSASPLPRVSAEVRRGDLVLRPSASRGEQTVVAGEIGDGAEGERARLSWTVPRNQLGGTLDLVFARNAALVLGATYAHDADQDAWGGSLGLALFEPRGEVLGWRLDLTYALQEMTASAVYTAEPFFDGPAEVRELASTEALHDASIMLTLDTHLDSPVNLVLSGGLGTKKLFGFDGLPANETSGDLDFSTRYGFWSPGVLVDLGGGHRVLAGLRSVHPHDIDGGSRAIRQVFAQFELRLGRPRGGDDPGR
jgi:hypothetical protein